MSTRSYIAKELEDGSIRYIYCHFDGYVEHNGRILVDHYSDSDKVNQLLDLGDLSSLGEEIGEKQDFNNRTSKTWCLAYGRDRGESDVEFKTFLSEQEFVDYYSDSGYYYLFDHGVWYVKGYKGDFKPLHEELAKLNKETA